MPRALWYLRVAPQHAWTINSPWLVKAEVVIPATRASPIVSNQVWRLRDLGLLLRTHIVCPTMSSHCTKCKSYKWKWGSTIPHNTLCEPYMFSSCISNKFSAYSMRSVVTSRIRPRSLSDVCNRQISKKKSEKWLLMAFVVVCKCSIPNYFRTYLQKRIWECRL